MLTFAAFKGSLGSNRTTTSVLLGWIVTLPNVMSIPRSNFQFVRLIGLSVMFKSSTYSKSSLPLKGLYMISLITTGPMRGPLLAAPKVVETIGYSLPVALGQRPKDSPLAAAGKSTWSMKFESFPAGVAETRYTSSPVALLNEKLVPTPGVGLKSLSSNTR